MSDNRLNSQERSDVRWWGFYGLRWLIAAIVLIALIAVVWAKVVTPTLLDTDAENRRSSFERQETYRNQVSDLIVEHEAATNDAHEAATLVRICERAEGIQGDWEGSSAEFAAREC